MHRKILAVIDGQLNPEITARYPLTLAAVCRARCYLCYTAGKETSPAIFIRAEESLSWVQVNEIF